MKALVLAILALSVVGCSSSPKVAANKPQYCHTSQNILVKNGETVDSATLLECTDDQIKRMPAVKLGMASNCGFTRHSFFVSSFNFLASIAVLPLSCFNRRTRATC